MNEKLAKYPSEVREFQAWYNAAETERHKLWDKISKEDRKFYWNDQWEPAVKAKLLKQLRPCLTFNEIAPVVDYVSGYQRQNRQDIKVIHKQNGTPITSKILTLLIKEIEDNCNSPWHLSRVFLDGLITGRGYLAHEIDYEDDPINGNVIQRRVNPFRVFVDPSSEEYDHSDADYMFQIKWQSRKHLELEFPDKADELKLLWVDPKDMIVAAEDYSSDYDITQTPQVSGAPFGRYKLRVKYCYYITKEKVTFLFYKSTGQFVQADKTGDDLELDIARQRIEGMDVQKVERSIKILHLATVCGNVKLQDIAKPFGEVNSYPIIPFYAYQADEHNHGLVTRIKDPQREINKRYSQFLHIISTSANSGWLVEKGAIDDVNKLKQQGSTPGHVTEYNRGRQKPEKIQPSQPSQGHVLMEQQGEDRMKRISGVNADLLGQRGKASEPGVVLELRQRQGNIVLEQIYDNFRLTRVLEGQFLRDVVQKSDMYTREEMIEIVIGSNENGLGDEVAQYQGGINQILTDLRIGKYQTKIDMTTSSPTIRLAEFYDLVQAAKSGIIPIPPEILIEASDFPEATKQKILERLAQLQAAPAP